MISNEKNFMANAMSGKTARACDYCVRRRARWYCAADDAFLCQTCDGSVHSANIVARRHQRIRLKTASLQRGDNLDFPSWHRGLTRKARTRRHPKNHHNNTQSTSSKSDEGISGMRIPLIVPEMGFEDNASNEEENEEQLIFRVPILDPFMAELCNSNNSQGFSPSDLEFPQFDVDVETLFGKGMDEESHGIEELGFLDCSDEKQKESIECCEMSSSGKVKAEEEGVMIDVTCEPFELSFDYEGRDCSKKEDEVCKEEEEKKKEQKMLMLRLDYEAIRDAWESNGGSPWMDGEKPEIDPHSCWPHLMGGGGQEIHQWYEENGVTTTQTVGRDGGREARVSRYREKRRTRLFSKKIRYEVRKLNAEKRPRMKGRFVKRTSCAQVSPTPFPLLSK